MELKYRAERWLNTVTVWAYFLPQKEKRYFNKGGSMEIQYAFKHMDGSEAIKTHAKEKSEQFKNLFQSNLSIKWNFLVEHGKHIAHVKATGKKIDVFAEATEENMYASIDKAAKKLEDQLLKIKDKQIK